MSINTKLLWIQSNLRATKDAWNDFSSFNYRSNEGILAALKPLLNQQQVTLLVSDSMKEVGGRVYVEVTTTLTCIDTSEAVSCTASAREPLSRKGMDESQITGATSSYARKYCLSAMFAIDDNKDADTMPPPEEEVYNKRQKGLFDKMIAENDALGMFVISKTATVNVWSALYQSFPRGEKGVNQAKVKELTDKGMKIANDWVLAIEDANGDESIVADFNEGTSRLVIDYIRDQLSSEAQMFFNEAVGE